MSQGSDVGDLDRPKRPRCAGRLLAVRGTGGEQWWGLEALEPRLLLSAYATAPEEPPPVDSVRFAQDAVVERLASAELSAPPAGLRPYGATAEDTSEYMLGEIVVTLVLMESNGHVDAQSENWTGQEISQVIAEVNQGLDWWEQTFAAQGFTSTLSFSLDTTWATTPFSTSYEPIRRPHTDQYLWINQFLAARGSGSGQSGAREFADHQRLAANADWSFTVFVVDSSNDTDGMFSDDYFSYAYLGGPFLVMTYDNDGWGIDNMDQVLAHEMAHIFYALDEYPDSVSYSAHSGYYDTPNLNAYDGNPHPAWRVASLMAETDLEAQAYSSHTSSTTSLEMIGWRDRDGDGIVDVLDVPLTLSLTGSLDIQTGLYRITGRSSVATMPNANPVASSLNHAITLNEVNVLQYRLDGGPWIDHATYSAHSVTIDATITVPVEAARIEIRTLCTESGVTSPVFTGSLIWAPRVQDLQVSQGAVTRPANITLTADAQDANGQVVSVAFYRESNGTAGLQTGAGGDALLGTDTISEGGWSLTFSSAGLKASTHSFYAQATDNDGLTSVRGRSAASVTCRVLNASPTVGLVTVAPDPVVRCDSVELTVHDVTDIDGTIRVAQFYRDMNGDGVVGTGDRHLGNGYRQPGTDDFVLRKATTGWATGDNGLLVRVLDNEAGSVTVAASVEVVNRPPMVSSLATSVSVVNRGAALWLRARPVDADGAVQKIEFYYDSDDNGTWDGSDLKIGEDVCGGDGWKLRYTLPVDAVTGGNRFFARATDNEAAVSDAASAVVRVNAPPVMGAVSSNGPVMRPDWVQLTAHDVIDSDGSIRIVQFFRDMNADGLIGAGDSYLGYGTRQLGTNDFVRRAKTTGWATGGNDVLVRAIDNNGGSILDGLSVAVTNRPPTVTALVSSLSAVRAGTNLPLTVKGAYDADGAIQKVELFRDGNDDGQLDEGDVFLAEDLSAYGGWQFVYNVPLDAVLGLTRFLARATDNEGAVSDVVSWVVRIDAPWVPA